MSGSHCPKVVLIEDMSAKTPSDPKTAATIVDGVTRIMSAGLADTLARYQDPALLEAGKINLITLDAIAQRFGARWPQRQDEVYRHVERTIQRHLGRHGSFARISETDYLVCQPDLGRFSGQAACLRRLKEIQTYFLRDSTQAEAGVLQVTRVTAREVDAEKIDPEQVEHGEEAEHAELPAAGDFATSEALEGLTVDRWSPFVASDGRELRVSCALEPVFELKGFSRIGFRMARGVRLVATEAELTPAMVSQLSRADILRIDLATIARGMDRLRAESSGEQDPSLIVPVSFTSLSNERTRVEIVTLLTAARSLVRKGIICEICDIEGAPASALLEATSVIRPVSLFVVGRLDVTPPASATVREMKRAGFQAVSAECPANLGQAEFLGWGKATVAAARRVARSVLIYRTDSARQAGLAAALGATHASVRQ